MRSVTRAIALLGGLVLPGLVFTPIVKAADLEPVVEEPAAFGWYVGLFGGIKWGEGDVEVTSRRFNCPPTEGCHFLDDVLEGEVDDGWIFGGVFGAQLTQNFRAEIEVSHAELDTESELTTTLAHDPPGGAPLVIDRVERHTDEDELSETFILGNVWVDLPLSGWVAPYFGIGAGVAHVNAEFGGADFDTGTHPPEDFSVEIEADDWAFAWQVGAGLRFGVWDGGMIDLGYRFKVINNVDLDDPEFCEGEPCGVTVQHFEADDDFDIHEHVVQVGLTFSF